MRTPTPTKGTYSRKLNIQHDVPPGEPAYVTYKRIRIDTSLVHEDRYAAEVIHAPKDS
ncbi:hypothetical protein [Paenibacillus amylolyticus]|uniref:hypothetical protein n=1 Tax=Paenibacillus amylolyticus TaxID=1451 RepID=UPI003EBA678B